jgi:hypothetical protein
VVTIFLKEHRPGSWILLNKDNKILSGPHQWGRETDAVLQARAFASTWGWRVELIK